MRDYIEELKCEHVPTDDLEDDFQENLDVSEDDLDDFEPDAPAAEEVPELGNIVNDEPEAPAEE